MPDEDTGVPQEFSAGAENVSKILGRLLGECLDLYRFILFHCGSASRNLYVSIVRIRVSGGNAKRHQDVVVLRIIKGFGHGVTEFFPVFDDDVAGSHRHHRSWVSPQNLVSGVSHARSGLLPDGFQKQVGTVQVRKLLLHDAAVFAQGYDQDVLLRYYPLAHLICSDKKRFAVSCQAEELLGIVFPAEGPETVSASTGHNYTVVVTVHMSVYYAVVLGFKNPVIRK